MSEDKTAIDQLKEEYLLQIKGLIPLHRVALFFITLVVVVSVQNLHYESVIESLLNLRVHSFFDITFGFFSDLKIKEALIAGSIILSGIFLQRFIRWGFFAWVKRKLSLGDVEKQMGASSKLHQKGSMADYLAFKRSESEAKKWAGKIAYLSSMSESATVLFTTFMFASYFGNFIDLILAIIFLICALLALAKSITSFLRKYLPHAVHMNSFLGIGGKVTLP